MGRRLFGIRRALLHERGQGTSVSCDKRLGDEAHRSQVSWTARTDGCHDGYHCRRNCLWKAWASKQNVGIEQVGKISKEYRGTCDQQACRNLKSILRPNQAQPRQSEECEGPEPVRARDETQQEGVREKRAKFDEASSAPASRRLQRLHQGQMQMRTMASNPREFEEKTLEGENSM